MEKAPQHDVEATRPDIETARLRPVTTDNRLANPVGNNLDSRSVKHLNAVLS